MNTQVVLSINVFKSLPTLMKQIETIQQYVRCDHIILLNCNTYMYSILMNHPLPNVIINPEIIDKRRYDGSVTHGFVSNMEYALKTITFRYFIVLSSRTIFYKQLDLENLDRLQPKWANMEEREQSRIGPFPNMDWHWSTLKQTALARHYLERGYKLSGSAHEGLCLSANVVRNIIAFFTKNPSIRDNTFNYNFFLEEFALQTIAMNEVDSSLEYGFLDLGHGVTDEYDPSAENKYTHKIPFLTEVSMPRATPLRSRDRKQSDRPGSIEALRAGLRMPTRQRKQEGRQDRNGPV